MQPLGALQRERLDQIFSGCDRLGGRVGVGGDREGPQLLDVVEEVGADGLGQDTPEQPAEEADVRTQLVRELVTCVATVFGRGLGVFLVTHVDDCSCPS